jgi:two-component sensor histidine kinase
MDDGRGFPVEVRANHGLALVSKLASTIGGSVHFRSNGGAEVSVIFPHETLPSLSPQPPAAA